MVKKIFKKTFNIREGEIRIVFLMQLYIFLIITVLLLVKPTVTALFLSNLGSEQLPYGYLLIAVVAILSSVFYNYMVRLFSIKVIASFTIIIFSAFFFLLSYVVYRGINDDWILYFYYLSISLFGVLVTSQFWVIANLVFDLREAKRLFGFIGAGAIAGGIFGGYLTSFLANFFGTGIVILTAAILLLMCLPIIMIVWKIRKEQVNKSMKEDKKEEDKSMFGSSFKIILKSNHLFNLASIVGISVLVAKLIDFQFNDFSNKAFENSNELASFFGFWFSSFNIIALLIQLFLTNKLLSRFGVTSNLSLLPLGLAIGSILFLTFPELWVLILIKGVDGSFKQSVNKAAFEVSFLPVPYNIKKQAKPFIDVVVDSVATGIAGFLLLFVIKGLNLDTTYITMITLFFLLLWFVMIYRLRRSYFDIFRKNIRNLVSSDKLSLKKNKKITSFQISDVLKNGSEKEILKLLDHMDHDQVKIYKRSIINLIGHPSDKVKAVAIKSVYAFNDEKILSEIKKLLEINKDDLVVYESMEYLLMHSSENKQTGLYKNYLDSDKDYIKNAALLCLARASRYNKILDEKYNLNKRIEDQIEEFTTYEDIQRKAELVALLLTIAYSKKEVYYSFIDKYLNSKDSVLKKFAIRAAGITKHEPYIHILISMITKKEHTKDVIEALKNYGKPIVQKLYIMNEEEELDENTRGYIPKILEGFDSRQSMVTLINLLESNDVLVRLNATKSLKVLKDKDIKLRLNDERLNENIFNESLFFKNTLSAIYSLEKTERTKAKKVKKAQYNSYKDEAAQRTSLLNLLKAHLDLSLETIFYLLSEKYKYSDMEVVFEGIRNDTEESRINAIEFLSNILDSELKDELLPILEYHFLSDKDVNLKIDVIPEKRSLNLLLKERGVATKIRVLKLMQFLNMGSTPVLKKLTKHKNLTVRKLAKKILATSSAN